MRYAIVINGVVDNIVDSDSPLASNWHLCTGSVAIGDLFDGNVYKPAPKQAEPPSQPTPAPALPVYNYTGPSVKVNNESREFSPAFFIRADSLLHIEADLVSPSGAQLAYSTQGEISTPVVRHSNGQPVAEELYFATTITNGRVVMSGRLPSGDWKLLPERINKALKFINAPFEVALSPITFIVSTPTS